MHIRQTLIRALALALTLLLVLGSTNPALAVQEAGMTVTKIDNDALDARLEQPIVAEPGEEAPYGDTDMVRVFHSPGEEIHSGGRIFYHRDYAE